MTLKPLQVMIVDDEAPARARLRDLLADINDEVPNRVIAEAANGIAAIEALEVLADKQVDVVLADIRMPKMGGVELARHLAQLHVQPAVIFVTAYDSYAVEAFELSAVDYLVKPVRAVRLAAALKKLLKAPMPSATTATLAQLPQEGRTHLSCHERGKLLLIPIAEVLYLKADFKYVTARTVAREFLLDESLTHLEEEFPERFIRLHRSVLVAKDAIVGFEKNLAEDADTQWQALLRGVPDKLPVSRRQWPLVKSYARQLSG